MTLELRVIHVLHGRSACVNGLAMGRLDVRDIDSGMEAGSFRLWVRLLDIGVDGWEDGQCRVAGGVDGRANLFVRHDCDGLGGKRETERRVVVEVGGGRLCGGGGWNLAAESRG
jgi:hypothetical protein